MLLGGDGLSPLSVLGLGMFLGLRHALDVDHVAAVWAIVSEAGTLRESSRIGLRWGIGHTLALLVAGVPVMVLGIRISPGMTQLLELAVAALLMFVGLSVLVRIVGGEKLHMHAHRHGRRLHVHPHLHGLRHDPVAGSHHVARDGVSPLLLGLVHGGAGSGALMLLVLSTVTSPWLGMAYIGVFGAGSIGGMIAMSLLVGVPARLPAERFAWLQRGGRLAAGTLSLGVGLSMACEIVFLG